MFGYTRFQYLNYFCVLLLAFLMAAFQGTFWFQVFGPVPPPLLWLNVILYLCLFRKPFEAILLAYVIAFLIKSFTAFPLGYMWLNLLIAGSIVIYIKNRFFWPGPRYYFFSGLGFSLLYEIISLLLNAIFDSHSMPIQFFMRLAEVLFTTLTAIPVIVFMTQLDRWTITDQFTEKSEGDTP